MGSKKIHNYFFVVAEMPWKLSDRLCAVLQETYPGISITHKPNENKVEVEFDGVVGWIDYTHLESEDVKPEHVEDLLWFHPGGEKVMVLDLFMFLVYEEMVYKVVEAML